MWRMQYRDIDMPVPGILLCVYDDLWLLPSALPGWCWKVLKHFAVVLFRFFMNWIAVSCVWWRYLNKVKLRSASKNWSMPCYKSTISGARGDVLGWHTVIQVGRSRFDSWRDHCIWFLMYVILLAAVWAPGWQTMTEMSTSNLGAKMVAST
jgi:hypothetical protein